MAKQLNVNLAFNADVSSARNNLLELQKTLQSIASTNVQFNINKDLISELLGALAALSMAQGGNQYIDSLIDKVEKEIEKNGKE